MYIQLTRARACALFSCAALLLSACGGGGGGSGGNPPPPPPPPPDTTAPDTTISAAPASLTNSASASFTFTSSETNSTFESRVDAAAFAAATSPQALTSVTDGSHTFEVRARDAAGNIDATPATRTWVVDTTPPDTQLTVTPNTTMTTQPATFSAIALGDVNATFEISVDNVAFVPATFPLSVLGLANGSHTFRTRAIDAAGNVDATPASFTWTLTAPPPPIAPDTTISGGPASLTNSTSASFTLSATVAGATFEYNLDNAGWLAATTPLQLTGLAESSHTILVRATAAGLTDATPASATWRVDRTPPTGTIVFPTPVSYTDAATLTVRGTASDSNALQSVSVNGVLASTATAFNTWRVSVPISPGNNTLTVSVTDAAGNTSASAATASVANRGPMLLWSAGADYDPTGNRIIVTDAEVHRLMAYSVATGLGELIADFSLVSTSTALAEPVVDVANNRALVLDWGQDALIAVNLANGDIRSTLSQGTGSGATSLTLGFGLAHDPAGNRAFATVRGSNAVIAINLATGVRTIVSSPTVGTGTAFGNPLGIAYDAAASRLLVADAPGSGAAIYSVDIATGNRVVLSQSPGAGSGPAMPGPTSLKIDTANNCLYVLDTTGNSVLRVDLATGNRTLIGNAATGTGPAINARPGLALRGSNGHLFATQIDGEILEINPGTLARSTVVSARVGPGLRVEHPQTVLAEQTSGVITSLLFGEPDAPRIMRLDLATGARTVVSGGSTGGGPALGRIVDFVLDTRAPANGHSIFGLVGSPGGALMSIDIATGDRAVLAALTANTQPRNLRLDASLNRVLYTNADFSGTLNGLYSIQLPGFGQTAISSSGVGTGPAFTGPSTFILEPATNPTRALFVDMNPWTWRTVDLGSGARGTFTSTSGNPSLPLLGPLFFDGPNSQIYGLNLYPPHLFVTTVAPGGGEIGRAMISGQVPGSLGIIGTGPLVDYGSGVCVDTARNVAFVTESTAGAVMAIDIASGDRVVIAR